MLVVIAVPLQTQVEVELDLVFPYFPYPIHLLIIVVALYDYLRRGDCLRSCVITATHLDLIADLQIRE